MLAFYMDESSDATQSRVFSASGILADTDDWFDIERQWEIRMKRDGVGYFHATDYVNMSGEFEKLADKYGLTNARVLADAMVRDLKTLLKSYNIGVFCLGCPMEMYRAVMKEPKPYVALNHDPYLLIQESLIHRVTLHIAKRYPHEMVSFVFDNNQKGSALTGLHWDKFKERVPRVASSIGTLSSLDDRMCPPLQAADLIAHTAKRAYDKAFAKPTIRYGELEHMSEWQDKVCEMAYLSADYLRDLVEVSWDTAVQGEFEPVLIEDSKATAETEPQAE